MHESVRRLLNDLDAESQKQGKYDDWMMSPDRARIAGPSHRVRVLTWRNIDEVCHKAGLDVLEMSKAYRKAIEKGDVIFVTYEESTDGRE